MRPTSLISGAIVLALVAPAVAQEEWNEFASREDGFSVNFPGQPMVEETTWTTQYRYTAPTRIYRANRGQERYSVTVVDYRTLEQQGLERAKQCPAGAEPCRGNQVGSLGAGYWRMDVRGALTYATLKFIQRDAKVTDLNWQIQELVEGLHIQLTNNADQSRTFGYMTMHENRLYIFEGTVPRGSRNRRCFRGQSASSTRRATGFGTRGSTQMPGMASGTTRCHHSQAVAAARAAPRPVRAADRELAAAARLRTDTRERSHSGGNPRGMCR